MFIQNHAGFAIFWTFKAFEEILISFSCYFFSGHKYYKDSDLLLFTCLEIYLFLIQSLLDLGWAILIFNG